MQQHLATALATAGLAGELRKMTSALARGTQVQALKCWPRPRNSISLSRQLMKLRSAAHCMRLTLCGLQ